MTILYARPYDLSAIGFYFESEEQFSEKSALIKNDQGRVVEEFEIQFIEGEPIDCDLANAMEISQANLPLFFNWIDEWDDQEKTAFIIAVGESGYEFDAKTDPNDFDVDLYYVDSLRELAEQFVEEGMFGDIPDMISMYIDYDAIARDLSVEFYEADVGGTKVIYHCR